MGSEAAAKSGAQVLMGVLQDRVLASFGFLIYCFFFLKAPVSCPVNYFFQPSFIPAAIYHPINHSQEVFRGVLERGGNEAFRALR